jgi:hypothetical protein
MTRPDPGSWDIQVEMLPADGAKRLLLKIPVH